MDGDNDNQRQADTEDVFDIPSDANADAEAQRLENENRQQQQSNQRQQQQQPQPNQQQQQPNANQQQRQQPELTEGMRLDEQSGRRYVIENGARVWIDPKPVEGDPNQQQSQQQQSQQQPNQQQQQANQPFDPAVLESIVRSVVGGMQPPANQQQQQQQQRQLTPEEEDRLMNRWRPNDDWFTKMQNPQTMKDAINEMRDGLIKESATAAKYLMDMYVSELKPVVEPLTQHVNEQRVTKWRNDFFSKYKVLEPYESLLDMVVKAKTADGQWKPVTRDKGFEEIAADVEKVIKTQNPQFSLANPPASQQNGQNQNGNGQNQQQQQQRQQPNQMSRTNTGGGNGGGNRANAVKSADEKLDGGIWS